MAISSRMRPAVHEYLKGHRRNSQVEQRLTSRLRTAFVGVMPSAQVKNEIAYAASLYGTRPNLQVGSHNTPEKMTAADLHAIVPQTYTEPNGEGGQRLRYGSMDIPHGWSAYWLDHDTFGVSDSKGGYVLQSVGERQVPGAKRANAFFYDALVDIQKNVYRLARGEPTKLVVGFDPRWT